MLVFQNNQSFGDPKYLTEALVPWWFRAEEDKGYLIVPCQQVQGLKVRRKMQKAMSCGKPEIQCRQNLTESTL